MKITLILDQLRSAAAKCMDLFRSRDRAAWAAAENISWNFFFAMMAGIVSYFGTLYACWQYPMLSPFISSICSLSFWLSFWGVFAGIGFLGVVVGVIEFVWLSVADRRERPRTWREDREELLRLRAAAIGCGAHGHEHLICLRCTDEDRVLVEAAEEDWRKESARIQMILFGECAD